MYYFGEHLADLRGMLFGFQKLKIYIHGRWLSNKKSKISWFAYLGTAYFFTGILDLGDKWKTYVRIKVDLIKRLVESVKPL